jgi:hypothetical protein
LIRKLEEFETCIRNNAKFIPNYGERYRYGETISTAFLESTINQVVSKRKGAHGLLQVRTGVLNDELRETIQTKIQSKVIKLNCRKCDS